MVLHQRPPLGVYLFDLQGIGYQPVGPRGHLAEEVRIPGSRHPGWSPDEDVYVGKHRPRRRAGQRLLVSVFLDRSAESRVPVHRRGGADAHVGPLALVGGALDYVVERPRADGDGYGVVLPECFDERLDIVVLGIKCGLSGKHVRLDELTVGLLEMSLHLLAGHPECVLVSDYDRLAVSKAFLEDVGDRGEDPLTDRNVSCIRRLLQGLFDTLIVHTSPPARM